MAKIAPQHPTVTGAAPAFTAAAAGDTLPNDGETELWVKNGSAAEITVTIPATETCSQGGIHDGGGPVPAASERRFGPFPRDRFGSEPAVNYSATASVTVAAFRI